MPTLDTQAWTHPLRAIAAMWLVALASLAAAQGYKGEEVDAKLSSRGALMKQYAKTQQGNPQAFKEYVEKYYFPAMTQPDPKSLANLEKMRTELFAQLIAPTTPQLQRYLSDQALAYAKRVVTGPAYHPAVRYNAVLALGQIDAKYAAPGSTEKPTPSTDANSLLCRVVASGATNAKVPRMLVVGALAGLQRHATLLDKLPQPSQRETLKTLYEVLAADNLAGEYAPGVREWVYTSAARGLASSAVAPPKGAVLKAFAKRLGDAKLDREARAEIAALIKELKPAAADVSPELIAAVEKLAVEVTKAEAKSASRFEDAQIRSGGMRVAGASGRSNDSRRMTADAEGMLVYQRAGVVAVLGDVLAALKTLAPIAGDRQATLESMGASISAAIESATDKESVDLTVADLVKQAADGVARAADPKKADEEEASF